MNDNEPFDRLIDNLRQAILVTVMACEVLAQRGVTEPSDFTNLLNLVWGVDAAAEALIAIVQPKA